LLEGDAEDLLERAVHAVGQRLAAVDVAELAQLVVAVAGADVVDEVEAVEVDGGGVREDGAGRGDAGDRLEAVLEHVHAQGGVELGRTAAALRAEARLL